MRDICAQICAKYYVADYLQELGFSNRDYEDCMLCCLYPNHPSCDGIRARLRGVDWSARQAAFDELRGLSFKEAFDDYERYLAEELARKLQEAAAEASDEVTDPSEPPSPENPSPATPGPGISEGDDEDDTGGDDWRFGWVGGRRFRRFWVPRVPIGQWGWIGGYYTAIWWEPRDPRCFAPHDYHQGFGGGGNYAGPPTFLPGGTPGNVY